MQKQINDGDTLYQEYTKISEPDRTPEQRVYLESWSGVRQGLEAKLAGIQEQKAQLEDKKKGLLVQMNKAGFSTEADLEAQITSLTEQKEDLDAKEKALLQQEQTLAVCNLSACT